MRADTIAFMAVRILALYLGASAINQLVEVISALDMLGASLAGPITYGVVAAVLWSSAPTISDRLLAGSGASDHDEEGAGDEAERSGLEYEDLLRGAVTIIGVWLIAQGVISLGYAAGSALASFELGGGRSSLLERLWYEVRWQVVGALVQLIVGGFTLAFASWIASGLARSWTLRRGVVRARRLELRDVAGDVRAMIAVEDDPDGGETAALTLFDDELRPRLRAVVDGASRIEVLDESGTPAWRAPQ